MNGAIKEQRQSQSMMFCRCCNPCTGSARCAMACKWAGESARSKSRQVSCDDLTASSLSYHSLFCRIETRAGNACRCLLHLCSDRRRPLFSRSIYQGDAQYIISSKKTTSSLVRAPLRLASNQEQALWRSLHALVTGGSL